MMKNQKLMNDNRRYWQHRLNEAEKQRQKRDDRLDRQMQRMYDKAYRDIQKELDAFYGRYMKRTGLSAEEVRKAAKDFDIKAFEERAKYYVENRDFSPRANTELALYNFKMRYNQLELLQANLDLTLIELGAKEESAIKKAKLEEIRRTYKENAGILGLSVPSEERLKQVAQSAINKPYYGARFSERIWSGHINPLRKYLNDRVSLTILAGQSPELLARDLKKRFDVTTNEARRLAVTEVGFMETEAQKLSYVDAGFERYGIQPEANACPQCRAIVDECEAEGGFLVAGMNPGLNAPLFHPWCRCGTYPIVPRDELDKLIEDSGIIEEREFKPATASDISLLQSLSDDVYNRFAKEEKEALDYYTEDGYLDINTDLQNGVVTDEAKHINKAISKYSLPKDIVVYKGTRGSYFEDKEVGDEFDLNVFYSTSLKKENAEFFYDQHRKDPGGAIIAEVRVPKEARSLYLGSNTNFEENEFEMLIDSRTRYKVLDINRNEDKEKIVLEVIKNGS